MIKDKKEKYLDIIIPSVASIIIGFLIISIFMNYKVVIHIFDNFIKILMPFIIAFIVTYILSPLVNFIENEFKTKRGITILIVYALTLGIIAITLSTILPKIFESILDIFKNSPQYTNCFMTFINKIGDKYNLGDLITSYTIKNYQQIVKSITSFASLGINTILTQTIHITTFIINLALGFIIAIYVIYDKEKFKSGSKKFIYIVFKNKLANDVIQFLKTVNNMVSLYIGTKAIDSLIIGFIALIGLVILKSPYALLLASIVGITNMIPYFGPFIGMIPAVVLNLFYIPIKSLWILIFLFLLQQFDAWFLEPKLVGHKVGISPFLIILGITLGGSLFGIIGMILSTPVMAVIKVYTCNILNKFNKA